MSRMHGVKVRNVTDTDDIWLQLHASRPPGTTQEGTVLHGVTVWVGLSPKIDPICFN